ncbi:MAG: CrcB family protein [Selenomonas sp.]|nr:CrcB family protein [Selenomonas sp.]
MMACLYVFIGGGLGALFRYGLTSMVGTCGGMLFPMATLVVNAVSCFFMGLVMGLLLPLAKSLHLIPESLRLLLTVGFLGGFSTLAAVSLETLMLFKNGSNLLAFLNIMGTMAVAMLTVWAGWQLAAFFQR